MVSGVVIGVSRSEGKAHVHVAECPHYPKHRKGLCPNPDTCCVYTDEVRVKDGVRVEVQIGDSFWWQAGQCYWTPKENREREGNRCGVDFDIALKKIGYSH